MGWLHVVDFLKLQVSFAKEPFKKRRYSAKETYDFKEPTNRSHPIVEYYNTLQRIATRTATHRSTLQHTARHYGVATDSRIDQIIGLFCKIMSLLQGSFTKETYDFIDPTDQSHPIGSSTVPHNRRYGVATISRLLEITGLFYKNIVFSIGLFFKRDL